MFWPRIAVAAAMATLLVVAPLMWWRGGRGAMQVAGRGPGEAREMTEAAVPPDETFAKGPAAAGAAVAPNVSLADNSRARLEPEQTPAEATAGALDETERFADAASEPPPAMMKGHVSKDIRGVETEQATVAAAAPAAPMAKARADQSEQSSTASVARKGEATTSSENRLAGQAAPPSGGNAPAANAAITIQRFAPGG